MLSLSRQTNPTLSRRAALGLVAMGLGAVALPTISGAPADDEPVALPEDATRADSGPDAPMQVIKVTDIAISADHSRLTFRVDVPKGQRFRVTLREKAGEFDGTRSEFLFFSDRFLFENERDVPAEIEMLFRYPKDPQGVNSDSVLLSQQEEVSLRVRTDRCQHRSLGTSVGVPLPNLPASQKQLTLFASEDQPGAVDSDGGRRLLLICPKSQYTSDVESIALRAELLVSLARPEPVKRRDPDPLRDVAAVWSRHAAEIGTARITFRYFRRRPLPLARERVNEILAAARLDESPQNLPQVGEELCGEKSLARWKQPWGEREFRCVGPKTRCDRRRDGVTSDIRIFDGELDMAHTVGSGQVDVAPRLIWARTKLHDFRLTPYASLAGRSKEIEVTSGSDGRIELRHPTGEILVDVATGFVFRWTRRNQDGVVISEQRQYHPVKYPTNIVFPTISVLARYSSERLSRITFTVIESAEFNEGLPSDTFTMALPPEVTLVDRRNDSFRPRTRRLREEVADLAAYLQERYPLTE